MSSRQDDDAATQAMDEETSTSASNESSSHRSSSPTIAQFQTNAGPAGSSSISATHEEKIDGIITSSSSSSKSINNNSVGIINDKRRLSASIKRILSNRKSNSSIPSNDNDADDNENDERDHDDENDETDDNGTKHYKQLFNLCANMGSNNFHTTFHNSNGNTRDDRPLTDINNNNNNRGLDVHERDRDNYKINNNDNNILHASADNSHSSSFKKWDNVVKFLKKSDLDTVQKSTLEKGRYDAVALHIVCKNNPPLDIIEVLLGASPQTARWTDEFKWLPLHYAAANSASEKVIEELVKAYPDGRLAQDNKGRTPLHLALGNRERPTKAATIKLLGNTGACIVADTNGMVPLHYACAYGASRDVLLTIMDVTVSCSVTSQNPLFTTILSVQDHTGRTPIHFAMGNCDKDESPMIVKLLLEREPDIVNAIETTTNSLPLHFLSSRANNLMKSKDFITEQERTNIKMCLGFYLNARPNSSANLFTTLQQLPTWLNDYAVVTAYIQQLLNKKISGRFPTAFMILDFYAMLLNFIFFTLAIEKALEVAAQAKNDLQDDTASINVPFKYVWPIYIGALWFVVRESLQVIAYIKLDIFGVWLSDWTNVFDAIYIVYLLALTILLNIGLWDESYFHILAVICMFILAIKFILYLANLYVDFAVFLSGVINVIRAFRPFMLALFIILVAFTQIFYATFQKQCINSKHLNINGLDPQFSSCAKNFDIEIDPVDDLVAQDFNNIRDWCNPEEYNAEVRFCTMWDAFLNIYTMLPGEVNDSLYKESNISLFFFIVFMFLVVILLANVLIALVTDSYDMIRNERAQIVFWSERLVFVAEMDAISSAGTAFFQKGRTKIPAGDIDEQELNNNLNSNLPYDSKYHQDDDSSALLWKKFINLFEENLSTMSIFTLEFWLHIYYRAITILFIIPIWLLAGVASAGYLWPPQIRAFLLEQKITRSKGAALVSDEERMDDNANLIKNELEAFHEEMSSKIGVDKKKIEEIRNELKILSEVAKDDMREMKQMMTILLELMS